MEDLHPRVFQVARPREFAAHDLAARDALVAVNEARKLRLGSLSFQPAELAKLTSVLFLAYHLERKGERVNEFLPSLFPVLLLLGWFAFLIFIQPDLCSAATVILIGLFVENVIFRTIETRTVRRWGMQS